VIAQDVLLGRPRAAAQAARQARVPVGGGGARAVLIVAFACVILFESATADPLLSLGTYVHRGIGSWSGLPLAITPLEILLLVGLVLALASASRERPSGESEGLGRPALAFVLTLLFGLVRGAVAGGDMYVAFWEARYLLYVPICFVIARTSLRRAEHVATLLQVGLISATLFGIEGVYRKLALINTEALGVAPEFYYEHDDVIFLATFVILALSAFVFGVRGRVRGWGIVAIPPLLYTLLASDRRAGTIVLLAGLLAVALTLFFVKRRAFFTGMVPVLATVALFLALTWNATGMLGQPARAIRSLSEPSARDEASNSYRSAETFNIRETIRDEPILGVGFGREFYMVIQLPDLSWWPFWRFETHNNVLWIWLKTGLAGYLAFWLLIGGALSRAAFAARQLLDPGLRLAALFSLVALVGTIVYGYVDLAFVSGRTTVLLGVVLGIVSVIPRLDRQALLAPWHPRADRVG
jgi:hypothetical protein